MKKIAILFALIFFVARTSFANQSTLDEIYSDFGRFIYYGHESIGISFLIDRESLEIATSDDSSLVISFNSIAHANNIEQEEIIGVEQLTYKYDLPTQKMFVFKDGWQYLDESKIDDSREISNQISAGELAYYLAKLNHFYDQYKSLEVQRFVFEGRSMLPLVKLPNDGDDQIWHVYNHATGEVEWWKWSDETQTGNMAFVRVK